MITDDMEEVNLSEGGPQSSKQKGQSQSQEVYDEDEDGPQGGVQCQTQ